MRDGISRLAIDWHGDPKLFLEAYFGEGMGGLAAADTSIRWEGHEHSLKSIARKGNRKEEEKVLFVPAQRVMAFHATNGWLRGWSDCFA